MHRVGRVDEEVTDPGRRRAIQNRPQRQPWRPQCDPVSGNCSDHEAPISGKSLGPQPMGSVPRTPWKYCGIVDKTPIIARIARAARITPQVNAAELKSVRPTNG